MFGRSGQRGLRLPVVLLGLAALLVLAVLLGTALWPILDLGPFDLGPGPGTGVLPDVDGSSREAVAETLSSVDGGVLQADVFIWDTTSTGIGAVRALLGAAQEYPLESIVIASPDGTIAAMPAQGLGVEDTYVDRKDAHTSGFWGEFRADVVEYYESRDAAGLNDQGRLVVEPDVAEHFFRAYLAATGPGGPELRFLSGHLRDVEVSKDGYAMELASSEAGSGTGSGTGSGGGTGSGTALTVKSTVAIDASVEGDLARLAGAQYRFGMSEEVYGGDEGRPPLPDGNRPETWIQRVSALLTLGFSENAENPDDPRGAGSSAGLSSGRVARYLTSYPNWVRIGEEEADGFEDSWSMENEIPGNKRELNEAWSDYPGDIMVPHRHIFDYDDDPAVRDELREEVLTYAVQQVRFLQEHGYPNLEIANLPERLYLREGIRVVGLTTYTGTDVEEEVVYHPVTFGKYASYDVHLPVRQDHAGRWISVPMETLIARGLPSLLIPGPLSTDHRAYNSAVRTEPVCANLGGAAGILAAVALSEGKEPAAVGYPEVREELLRQSYRLTE